MIDINLVIPVVGLWIVAGMMFTLFRLFDFKPGEVKKRWTKDKSDFILFLIINVILWPKLLPKKEKETEVKESVTSTKKKTESPKPRKTSNRF